MSDFKFEDDSKRCSMFNKVVLLCGSTGSGKSTILNSFFNHSIDYNLLKKPANTNFGMSSGTTTIDFYYDMNLMLIDTPGFGEVTITNKMIKDLMFKMIKSLAIGINVVLLCIDNSRIAVDVCKGFQLLETFFGKRLYDKTIVCITKDDEDSFDIEKTPLLVKKFLKKFPVLINGSMINSRNKKLEEIYKESRREFFNKIVKNINSKSSSPKLYIEESFKEKIVEMIWEFFGVKTDYQKIRTDVLNKTKRIHIKPEDCSICLEDDIKDLMLTPCFHSFHFDCLLTWLDGRNTCPNCRCVIKTNKIIKAKMIDKKINSDKSDDNLELFKMNC